MWNYLSGVKPPSEFEKKLEAQPTEPVSLTWQ